MMKNVKIQKIILLLLSGISSLLSAKQNYLLVFCQSPYVDTIWNYENWLHKKDTTFILGVHKFDKLHFFEFQYKMNTESHLIVCYEYDDYRNQTVFESKYGGIFYTAQMFLCGNKLLKHGYLTRYVHRAPVLEYYAYGKIKEYRTYFKPNKHWYTKALGLRIASITQYSILNSIKFQTFDSIGNLIRKGRIQNHKLVFDHMHENKVLKKNDLILVGVREIDTIENVKSILMKSDTVIVLKSYTWKKSNNISVKTLERMGQNLIIKFAFYVDKVDSVHCLYRSKTVFKSCGKNKFVWKQMSTFNEIEDVLIKPNYKIFKILGRNNECIYYCEYKTLKFNRMKEIIYDENKQVLRISILKNKFYIKHKYTHDGFLRKAEFNSTFEPRDSEFKLEH